MQFKRAQVERGVLWVRHIWTAHNGRYRVSRFQYRDRSRCVFYAETFDSSCNCWDVISTHKKRARAESSCAQHERRSRCLSNK